VSLARHARPALALGVLVALMGVEPARAGEPVRGEVAEAYRQWSGSSSKVWKLYSAGAFRGGKLLVYGRGEREGAARKQAALMTKLRDDSEFRTRFPKVIPTTRYDESLGGVEQSTRDGVLLDRLSGRDRERAEAEMSTAIGMARRITGEAVNEDPANFLLGYNGELRGWVSLAPRPTGYYLPVQVVRELGSGANSLAYEVEVKQDGYRSLRVAKILRAYSDRRFPSKAPPAELEKLTRKAEEVAEGVGKDEAFRARFGDVIPKTVAAAPGVLLQEMAKGVFYDTLGPRQQERAAAEVKEAVELGKNVFPKVVFSKRKKNFLFDRETGAITSWYDMIADGVRSYQKAGITERD
jgi:hypothetical protein